MATVMSATHPTTTHTERPHSPIRIDWAACQSESQDSDERKDATHHDLLATPPQQVTGKEVAFKDFIDGTSGGISSAAKRVYKIPELMKYRNSLTGIAVFARIKPEALAENLFQYIGFNRPLNITTRSRGLSELSNISHGSTYSSDVPHRSFQTKIAGHPHRQPLAPPDNKGLQQNAGFARFLKQHASPPHHRVTAGGRIVPAGPLSPPPMFDYASLTGIVRDRSVNSQVAASKEHVRVSDQRNLDGHPQLESAVTISGFPQTPNNLLQSNSKSTKTRYSSHTAMAQTLQPLTSLAPVGIFDDGATMAYCNGVYYRTYWDGLGTVIEPLHIAPAQPVFPNPTVSGLQTSLHANPTVSGSSSFQPQSQPAPLAIATNRSHSSSAQSIRNTYSSGMDAEHSKLKANLHDLDKHLALHHFDLSQDERASFVHHRKALVEQIDAIRRSRETSKQDTPATAPVRDFVGFSRNRHVSSVSSRRASHSVSLEKCSGLQAFRASKSRKPLSPSAPPFIPRSMTQTTPIKNPPVNAPSNSDESLQAKPISEAQIPFGTPRNPAQLPTRSYGSAGYSESYPEEQSAERNLQDAAMRIIHQGDVEYAQRYLDDRTNGKKRYCSSVSEFQEAVRRVREQARLYGCAGGSSKDPAYDAEQDIWWAICDRDPIPLPSKIPDHVANPRPWDWNDSAFNYRRTTVVSAHLEKPPTDAGNSLPSPRCDPKATERASNIANRSSSPLHRHVQLESKPSHGNVDVSNSDKTPLPNPSNSLHPKIGDISGSLEEQEYKAVQHAIEVLNKRSKAIMAQVKASGTIPSLHIRAEDDGGISRFQLALENYSKAQEIRTRSEPKSVPTIPKAQDPDQRSAFECPKSGAAERSGDQRPLKHSSAEKFARQDISAPNRNEKVMVCSGTRQSKETVPKRRSSVRKSTSSTPSHSEQHSGSRPQIRRKKPLASYTEIGADSIASVLTRETSAEPSQASMELESPKKRKRQISPRKAAKKAKALFHKGRSRSPQGELLQQAQIESPIGPRVRLPTCIKAQEVERRESKLGDGSEKPQGAGAALKAFHSNEVKAIAVTRPSSDTFLQDMLKSPRFSSSKPLTNSKANKQPKTSPYGMDTLLEQKYEEAQANKENALTEPTMTTGTGDTCIETKGSKHYDHHGLLGGKARSSLAASVYHASGYLPQYDGAGRAHTSTIHQQNGNGSHHRQARVNLPEHSSYEDRPAPLRSKSHYANNRGSIARHSYSTSLSLGLDGSGESPSENNPVALEKNTKDSRINEQRFDTMGVTTADFHQQRPNPNNAWHHGQVDDLFKDIAEQEAEYMIVRKRQNTKTA